MIVEYQKKLMKIQKLKRKLKQASRGTMNQHHSALSEILEKTFFSIFENYSPFILKLN